MSRRSVLLLMTSSVLGFFVLTNSIVNHYDPFKFKPPSDPRCGEYNNDSDIVYQQMGDKCRPRKL